VSFFLLSHPLRGPGHGSFLVGKSVHNQRVERMWHNVYQGVTGLYNNLFSPLENVYLLNPDNCFVSTTFSYPELTDIYNFGVWLG